MKWFDAGTKKMIVTSFGNFIKLSCNVQGHRPIGLAHAQTGRQGASLSQTLERERERRPGGGIEKDKQ